MSALVHYCEQAVDRLSNQVEMPISSEQADALVASGSYQRDSGLKGGRHYRKRRGDGCYHLRLYRGRAWLHWDRWDPRRFPIRHFFETPALWVPTLSVAALGILAGLGSGSRGSRNVTYDSSTGRYRDEHGRFTRSSR